MNIEKGRRKRDSPTLYRYPGVDFLVNRAPFGPKSPSSTPVTTQYIFDGTPTSAPHTRRFHRHLSPPRMPPCYRLSPAMSELPTIQPLGQLLR